MMAVMVTTTVVVMVVGKGVFMMKRKHTFHRHRRKL
jgi:hypothetical protein